VIAAALRIGWRRFAAAESPVWERWALAIAPAAALAILGGSLSLPGSPWPALVAFWAILVVEESLVWLVLRRAPTIRRRARPRAVVRPKTAEVDAAHRPPDVAAGAAAAGSAVERRFDPPQGLSPHLPPGNVSQQFTRAVQEDGTDVMLGVLRGRFAPKQRTLRLHVAFCPPFDVVPEVTVEATDGPPVTASVAQVLPYGARLDLRLGRPSDEPQEVVLELFVRAKGQ